VRSLRPGMLGGLSNRSRTGVAIVPNSTRLTAPELSRRDSGHGFKAEISRAMTRTVLIEPLTTRARWPFILNVESTRRSPPGSREGGNFE
jgi:hypothetical protein